MSIDKLTNKAFYQQQAVQATKTKETAGQEGKEVEKSSLPSMPKPPDGEMSGWEKTGNIAKKMNENLLEDKDFEKVFQNSPIKIKEQEPVKKKEEISSEEKQKDIMSQFKDHPEALAVYEKLNPEEKKKFMALAEKLYTPGREGNYMQFPVPKGTDETLLKLLEKDNLLNKDSHGNSLLDNLEKLSGQKFNRRLNGDFILRETIGKIAYSGDKAIRSDISAKMEHKYIKNNPSEYARIIGGLSGEEGEVKLPNGNPLKRGEWAFWRHDILNRLSPEERERAFQNPGPGMIFSMSALTAPVNTEELFVSALSGLLPNKNLSPQEIDRVIEEAFQE